MAPDPRADGPTLTLSPIGYLRSPHEEKHRAPRQPGAGPAPVVARLELVGGHNFEAALEDLEGVEKIWLLYWFHRNEGWRPKVLPPRGARRRRGVFATRSPHRPNPLGLSLVNLLRVHKRVLELGDVDLLDGTPVFDIKPYLPYAEAWPDARAGWLDPIMAAEREGAAQRYRVVWAPRAAEQRDFLEALGVALAAVVEPTLARDPAEHRHHRRVMAAPDPDDAMMMAVRSWRVFFRVEGLTVWVHRVASGYPRATVEAAPEGSLLDDTAHRAFWLRWP
ncbi:MAG: tRNA (N6-threonylcarbamoyladenosine(37)-N6)-methyltransferase TrmO [Myxococcales bacterium]|nr:tRNA (N6-threonylcarbamoyladenosine(37)-N6)-methyltransferase TrmO [Myxococcales bacterium]